MTLETEGLLKVLINNFSLNAFCKDLVTFQLFHFCETESVVFWAI